MYLKVVCEINDKLEIDKHYDIRYGAPGMPRQKRGKRTPEEMAAQNMWRRKRYLRRLIELNFQGGDWHVTLTCRSEDRPTTEEAPGRIRSFRDALRREYKKRGWALKYIITCEVGKRGATHWHMIVNDMHDGESSTAKLIRRLWVWGRLYFSPLDDTGDYGKLAEYIIKESAGRIARGETAEKLSYMCSRNLSRPVGRKEKCRARGWRKMPRVPPGWQLVSGTLVNGVNKFNGLPYQHYTIRKVKGKDGGYEDSKGLYRDGPAGTGPRKRKGGLHHADGSPERAAP